MSKKKKISVEIFRDDDVGGFACYLRPSVIVSGKAIVKLNIEATMHASVANGLNPKEFLVQNIMHEVGHAMEDFLDIELGEDTIEEMVEQYKSKYQIEEIEDDGIVKAKEMCNKIIELYEQDIIHITDPFNKCYEIAKETLTELSRSET